MRVQFLLSNLLSPSSFQINEYGGAYQHGKPYPTAKKLDVADAYFDLKLSPGGLDPTPTNVARKAQVDWHTAKKVMDEIEDHHRVLSPEEIRAQRPEPLGVGSQSLSLDDEKYLEYLYYKNRSRTNQSYVDELAKERGKVVSTSLIQKWWMQRWEFPAKFVVPDKTPLDKFRPENLMRMVEYGDLMGGIHDHRRLHFLDATKVSGKDFYFRKARKDPHDGSTPSIAVPGDFRESYNMFASTTAWSDAPNAVEAIWTDDSGDSFSTMYFLAYLISIGHFRHGDVAVFDRWSGHFQGEADILEDFLWDAPGPDGAPMNILAVLLPARCPELNPIELIFQTIKERMKSEPYAYGILGAARWTTLNIDTELVLKTMIHCGY